MNVYDLFPSRYVAAVDLNGHDVTVEIHHVEIEEMGAPPKVELKPVVHFSNAKKGMVLNKTNAMLISSLYGPETDGWAGKRITLYVANVKAFGSMQKAIRVREFIPRPKPTDSVPDSLMTQPEADDGPDLDYQEEVPKQQASAAQGPAEANAEVDFREPTEEQCNKFIQWARRMEHDPDAGPCTEEQYRYLTGVIDGITGQTTHKDVLGLLCGRTISSENLPAFNLASKLLDWLPETYGSERNHDKRANLDYKPDYAACIRRLHETVMEGRGQSKLLEV